MPPQTILDTIPPTDFPTLAKAEECAIRNQHDDMDGWTYHAVPCSVPGHYIVMVHDEAGEILGAL